MLATSITLLILFLPAACLPLVLVLFSSNSELEEMGILLESSDDTFPMQGYEPVGFLREAIHCDRWKINKQF